jgi:hypothetical protein
MKSYLSAFRVLKGRAILSLVENMATAFDSAHRLKYAKEFLRDLLARGPVTVVNIRHAAANTGWSTGVGWAAIKHAKRELGLIAAGCLKQSDSCSANPQEHNSINSL